MTDFEVTEVGAVDAAYERGRIAGLREAAILAQSRWKAWDDESNVSCDLTACENIAGAILALIPDAQEAEE